ncbi:hypothetical protein [Motilimonas sp. E26]|uniref:hypothetical protein n=1 Tax=Motilimonas sp. E26 TaxID=2865674 RepID=UPI001E5D4496|nr:hypothetical protein [Motilimonas sp. E26]MCE0556311.1 hypothetical protein [Motilimonas sp. E26]
MNKSVTLTYLDGRVEKIRCQNKPFSSGADGAIYASTDNKLAFKIYHDPSKDSQRQEKLWQMLSHAPKAKGFCWPIAVLGDHHGTFIGYAMPLLDLTSHHPLEMLLTKRSRQSLGITESYPFRLTVATNLAKKIAELHRLGHHVIDLKPVNLSFDKHTGDVVILDCDGFSIKGNTKQYTGHQYTAGYIAPEAFRAKQPPEKLGLEQDLFALATIIFQLLNNGLHPFQGVPVKGKQLPSDNQGRIAAGLYAYDENPHFEIQPSPWSIHSDFPDVLQQAFTQSLTSVTRTNAALWQQLLKEQKHKLKTCHNNSNHMFWQSQCPHCLLNQASEHAFKTAIVNMHSLPERASAPQVKGMSSVVIAPSVNLPPQQSNYAQPISLKKFWSIFAAVFLPFIVIVLIMHNINEDRARLGQPPVTANTGTAPNSSPSAGTRDNRSEQTVEKLTQPQQHYIPKVVATRSLSGKVKYRSLAELPSKSKFLAEVPFHQLTRFESAENFPLIKYSPHGAMMANGAPGLSLNQINFEMAGQIMGQLDYWDDRVYQLADWQYDKHANKAYVYQCKYNPGVCTHVSQVSAGEMLNYEFNLFSAEKIYPDGEEKAPENSYRPWRFSLTQNGEKLVMASNFELVVYNTEQPQQPLLKQRLPDAWQGWKITRILTVENGQRLFMSFAKSERYGLNYQGFVVELSLVEGQYQVTTDFSTFAGANPMSGLDIAANLQGDILAIGEYIEAEQNSEKYAVFGKPVEVALAYPSISLWRKTPQGWQPFNGENDEATSIIVHKYTHGKELVSVPENASYFHVNMSLGSDFDLKGSLALNRGFMLNHSGDLLLTGIQAKQKRYTIDVEASIYQLSNADKNAEKGPSIKAKLVKQYDLPADSNVWDSGAELGYLSASLSEDGTQAAMGYFVFSDSKQVGMGKGTASQTYQLDLFDLQSN